MLKSMLFVIVIILISLLVYAVAFVHLAPQLGAVHDSEHKQKMQNSAQYSGELFVNQIPTNTAGSSDDENAEGMLSILYKFVKGVPGQAPKQDLPVLKVDPQLQMQDPNLVWFGHSSFLLNTAGKTLFFDPVFAEKASPHPWLGSKRYNKEFPMTPEQLPAIDAVVISHDHYDHLDHQSILDLDHKVAQYFVPYGVGSHLIAWGISSDKIVELDWWQSDTIGDVELTLTPSRHFSGRRITNQNQTLWGSWYVKTQEHSLFFSGDTGYGPHFTEIRERLGAPDFALLECGQYNLAWADIHMLPEQTVQAAQDLQAKVFMPVHWASFTLALHTWTDPVQRAQAEAKKRQQAMVAPQIGEVLNLRREPIQRDPWWQLY